jgi:hypothetical protein
MTRLKKAARKPPLEHSAQIPSLKIWNQDIGASHYRTECSRDYEWRSIRRSTRAASIGVFGTALVPLSRPHLFIGCPAGQPMRRVHEALPRLAYDEHHLPDDALDL